jgi:hypothetical protein
VRKTLQVKQCMTLRIVKGMVPGSDSII